MKYRLLSSCVAVALGAWALSGCVVRGRGGVGVSSTINVPPPPQVNATATLSRAVASLRYAFGSVESASNS